MGDDADDEQLQNPVPETNCAVEVRLPVLVRGDKGPCVEALQALLIGYGHDLGRTGRDGDFGPLTDAALRKYQSRQNLQVSGTTDGQTWESLLKWDIQPVGR